MKVLVPSCPDETGRLLSSYVSGSIAEMMDSRTALWYDVLEFSMVLLLSVKYNKGTIMNIAPGIIGS